MSKSRKVRGVALFMSITMFMLTLFSMPLVPQTVEAASLKDLQADLEALKQQQAAVDKKLASLKNEALAQEEYRNSLNEKIANAQGQIDNLNEQIAALDVQITQKENEIVESENQIDADYETLKQRLKLMYMLGEASLLDIVLSAESVVDYFNKSEFVSAIVKHDNEIIENLKEETEAIRQEKESIETDRATVTKARTELDTQKAELEAAVAESKRVTAKLQAEAANAEAEQKRLKKLKEQKDNAIEQWWIQYYKEQAALKEQANKINGTGTFMWPMPGYASKSNLTDLFGAGRGHRGVDIAGANIAGKEFVAADTGKVVYVSYNDPIYGIYCMIDHGNNISTLYGHCSALSVKVGQVVKKGQVIGRVGRSGIATGFHLHFGVLKNGVAIDPMQFFKIGK